MGETRRPPPSMDSIKKKMQSLARETANATARAEKWEKEVASINATADAFEEQVKNLQKKIQQTESAFDVCTEDLFNQTIKLEERLAISATNLAKTSIDADQSIKDQHVISEVCAKKSENNDGLETQLKDAQYTLTESENKYETLARKLNTMETEAVRSNERAETVETKFIDIEDELKVVGANQQA